jgi:hypothetical protein
MAATSHYLAATSDAPLEDVCAHLEAALGTGPFELDGHAHWRYGEARGGGLHLNVTRCDDTETIETWIEGTPPGVNYQVVLTCPEQGSEELLARLGAALEEALGTRARGFHVRREASSGGGPLATVVEDGAGDQEVSSGFSLPFSWFLVIGVALAVFLVVRGCGA